MKRTPLLLCCIWLTSPVLLADTLALSRESVRVVSGHGARDKIVELTGIDPPNVERRLATASGKEVV